MEKIREIKREDVELVQKMFALGMEAWEHSNRGYEWIDYKKKELLRMVNNDPVMTSFLMEIFECGRAVGEKRELRRRMENT